MIVGTDTYIDVAEADAYIADHYIDPAAWDELTDAHKKIMLRQALQIIEAQPFAGVKAISTQPLAFPRHYPDYYPDAGVPADVAQAQAELAYALVTMDDSKMQQMQGVKSYRVGHLSETFTGTKNDIRVLSGTAFRLLNQYIGAVRVN